MIQEIKKPGNKLWDTVGQEKGEERGRNGESIPD